MTTKLRVSATSEVKSVAGAIAGAIRRGEDIEIVSIGAGAVNQAVKSLIVAKGYIASNDIDFYIAPEFVQIDIDGISKTAIVFLVTAKK